MDAKDIWIETYETDNHTVQSVTTKKRLSFYGREAYLRLSFSVYEDWQENDIGLTGVRLFYVAQEESVNACYDSVKTALTNEHQTLQSSETLLSVSTAYPEIKKFYGQNVAENFDEVGSRSPYYQIYVEIQTHDGGNEFVDLVPLSKTEKIFILPDVVVTFDGLFPAVLSHMNSK